MGERILDVQDLGVSFFTHLGEVQAVRGVSFFVEQGDILGIAGESGSGKSVTAMAIMGLVQPPGRVTRGKVVFRGETLTGMDDKQMNRIRGKGIAMVFQDPMTSLNPVLRIGYQLSEGIRRHSAVSRAQARERSIQLLGQVRIPSADARLKSYPFELSGGMRQRVMFAMAIANKPHLLIADEPTTALDVTIQNQVLVLMKQLNAEIGASSILITHDLGVIAETCTKVLILYGGMVMEQATVDELFDAPRHPYTMCLQQSIPRLDQAQKRRLYSIPGSPPNMIYPPAGCPFAPRCEHTMRICQLHMPELTPLSATHACRCWLLDPRSQAAPPQEGGAHER